MITSMDQVIARGANIFLSFYVKAGVMPRLFWFDWLGLNQNLCACSTSITSQI